MTGLVLEGGANRAYFSVGAMDAMMDMNIECDYIIGVSAGISNGTAYAAKQRGRGYKIGTEYVNDKRYTGFKYFFDKSNRSYYNMKFVFDEVPNKYVPFDHKGLEEYKGQIYAGVTNLKTGKPEYMPLDRSDRSWTLLKASCALPLMFPPIEYRGGLYMDGGVADPIPVKRAVEDGCHKIVAILTREREYVKKPDLSSKLASGLYRKYPGFATTLKTRHSTYNQSKELLFNLEKEGKAFIIAPESTKGWKRTDGSPEVIKGFYDLGYKYVKEREKEFLDFING